MYLKELFDYKYEPIFEGFDVNPSTAEVTITFDPSIIIEEEFNSILKDVNEWNDRGVSSWMVNGTPINDALSASNYMKGQVGNRITVSENINENSGNQTKLRVDNPGGDWLRGKIEYAKEMGRNVHGKPFMSTMTGSFSDYVRLPVSLLKNIPGASGEQKNVRQEDLDWLTNYMQANDRLPPMSKDNDSEYAPFIVVGYDGQPWVSEGNHRIMAAAKLGWKTLPVELRYFDGGESVPGPLHPDNIKNMGNTVIDENFNITKDWKGWWIDENGNRIDVDYENDYHHENVASDHLNQYVDDPEDLDLEGYLEVALNRGWIRVYDRPQEFGMEFNSMSPETKKYALRQLRDQRDKMEFYINNERFDNIRDAQNYIREL